MTMSTGGSCLTRAACLLGFFSTSYAARCVARHGVHSHAVLVTLVGASCDSRSRQRAGGRCCEAASAKCEPVVGSGRRFSDRGLPVPAEPSEMPCNYWGFSHHREGFT